MYKQIMFQLLFIYIDNQHINFINIAINFNVKDFTTIYDYHFFSSHFLRLYV
jgi:hypothetical protein